MNFIPSISDFVTENDFIKLQNKFISYDDKITEDFQTISKKDFSIVFITKNYKNEDVYNTVFFYNDFLFEKIPTMAEIEINSLTKSIVQIFQYNDHERKNFIEHQISVYEDCEKRIHDSTFLTDDIKAITITQTGKVLAFLYDDIILKDIFKKEDKMKIRMNRNDIQMLFFLLRQAKLIDHPHDADLGRLIDNFFLYHNDETNEFLEIKKSNKDLSDYKNYNKTVKNSIVRLKTVFANENFYNLHI